MSQKISHDFITEHLVTTHEYDFTRWFVLIHYLKINFLVLDHFVTQFLSNFIKWLILNNKVKKTFSSFFFDRNQQSFSSSFKSIISSCEIFQRISLLYDNYIITLTLTIKIALIFYSDPWHRALINLYKGNNAFTARNWPKL
jgi:hypothetical protein